MKMTERDRKILQFINAAGWCIAPQLSRRFSMKWWILYRLMKRLKDENLVIHRRIRLDQYGIFYLTSDGAKYTDLPAIERIPDGLFAHQKLLVDVVIRLHELYPDIVWVSERHLNHEKFIKGIGKRGHVSDGLLVFPDNRRIAIEVELSVKGKYRLKEILSVYAAQPDLKEIWYFCSPAAMRLLNELAGKKSYIKIISIEEFLA